MAGAMASSVTATLVSSYQRRRIIFRNESSKHKVLNKLIKIFQWHCLGIRHNFSSLLSEVMDIFCIQETLLKNHSNYSVKGFNVVRNDITQLGDRGVHFDSGEYKIRNHYL